MPKILYIHLTDEEHKKLKTFASFTGNSLTEVIKDYIKSIDIKIELKE